LEIFSSVGVSPKDSAMVDGLTLNHPWPSGQENPVKSLRSRYIGTGLSDAHLEVPRLRSTTQAIPVHLRNLAMATRIKLILEARALDYRVSSTLYLFDGRRTHRCRLMHDARLALQEFQAPLRGVDTEHP
jgi:hypothetical protein